ncbi:hypothetical protein RUND412_000446 [Rhizina undulata]
MRENDRQEPQSILSAIVKQLSLMSSSVFDDAPMNSEADEPCSCIFLLQALEKTVDTLAYFYCKHHCKATISLEFLGF